MVTTEREKRAWRVGAHDKDLQSLGTSLVVVTAAATAGPPARVPVAASEGDLCLDRAPSFAAIPWIEAVTDRIFIRDAAAARGVVFGVVVVILSLLGGLSAAADPSSGSLSAVAPAQGTVSRPELVAVVVEIRSQLRAHGRTVAVQQAVREALAREGAAGPPTGEQLSAAASRLGAMDIFVPLVLGSGVGEYELRLLRVVAGESPEAVAVTSTLPQRGAGVFTKKEVRPAVAASVASLLGTHPNPVDGPFPMVTEVEAALVMASGPEEPPGIPNGETPAPAETRTPAEEGTVILSSGPPDAEAKIQGGEGRWNRWDHRGLFGEMGFLFSWCRRDGICAHTTKGYGVRIRAGVRIMSYVSLSVSGIAMDHQMPLTTDLEVFLSVENAFVFAGAFGGLRFHPVRKFFVDPYIGLDVGRLWLLYASNKELEPNEIISPYLSEDLQTLYARRETIYLTGLAVAPEIGVNLFIVPALALGFHVQWIIPFWKRACASVYDPSVEAFKSAEQMCEEVSGVGASEAMDSRTAEMLGDDSNLPRFISIELDLTLFFK